jgi:hypothetical protein
MVNSTVSTQTSRIAFFSLFLVLSCAVSAQAGESNTLDSSKVSINTVPIKGIEAIHRLRPELHDPARLAELNSSMEENGLDELVFLLPDSSMWLAFGTHMQLYTRTLDRIRYARYDNVNIVVVGIDNESDNIDLRPVLGRKLALVILGIALGGLIAGVIQGYIIYLRTPLSGFGRIIERTLYGLVIGILLALMVYGISGYRLDMNVLMYLTPEKIFYEFMVEPPSL